jgi:DNA-binding beta-propeller fold protein YncE
MYANFYLHTHTGYGIFSLMNTYTIPMVSRKPLLLLLALTLLAAPGFASGREEARPSVRRAYLPNAKEGNASAIDLTAGVVTGNVKIGSIASHGIAASPDGRIVYAGDAERNELVIIDGEFQLTMRCMASTYLPMGGLSG